MAVLLDMDAEDAGAVVMAAACWVMGLPVDRSDEAKVSALARHIEDAAAHFTDERTGRPLGFKEGWWRSE